MIGTELTHRSFHELLGWLHPDRDQAEKEYEEIRGRLIKIFTCRGVRVAEDLADETITRVATKIHEVAESYAGDPRLYFYGVARYVYLEHVRQKPAPAAPPRPPSNDANEKESEYQCLEACMAKLPRRSHDLIVQYYREDKGARTDHRKALAEGLGIALNALRIQVWRIRAGLHTCMTKCLKAQSKGGIGLAPDAYWGSYDARRGKRQEP